MWLREEGRNATTLAGHAAETKKMRLSAFSAKCFKGERVPDNARCPFTGGFTKRFSPLSVKIPKIFAIVSSFFGSNPLYITNSVVAMPTQKCWPIPGKNY